MEVKDGGEKLDQLNDNMGDADKKAEEALTELKSAAKYSKKSGKCVCFLVYLIVLGLITVGLVMYFVFKPGSDKK